MPIYLNVMILNPYFPLDYLILEKYFQADTVFCWFDYILEEVILLPVITLFSLPRGPVSLF